MMTQGDYYSLNPWWEGKKFPTGFTRNKYLSLIERRFRRKQIEILTGSRRVGKTTLLKQIIERLITLGIAPEDILYVPLDFAKSIGISIQEHLTVFRQIFSHRLKKRVYIFLDEVQDSPNWQTELKSIYDAQNLKMFCSGSTSFLISAHGGKLTGRQINTVVYPLDFEEFLKFRKVKISRGEAYILEKEAEKYLELGGYPEQVLSPSNEYLSSLLEDIFARDLGRIYPIRNPQVVRDLYKLLAAGVGTRTSYNRLSKILGISADTVKDYIHYFEQSYLTGKLEQWSYSYTKRAYGPKKIYLLDNGIKTLLTGTGDLGAKAESAVYWKLKQNLSHFGYLYENEKETDFVWGKGNVEVKYTSDPNKVAQPAILTVTKNLEGKNLIPLWQFLLDHLLMVE